MNRHREGEASVLPGSSCASAVRELRRLSIVTTCDPRQEVMPRFLAAIGEYAVRRRIPVELVVVDDLGAFDAVPAGSWRACEPVALRVLSGHPAGGQDLAVLKGILAAEGDVIVAIDPDMYANVADLDAMLSAWAGGADIVYAWRRIRRDTSVMRRLASWAFNAVIRTWTGARLHDINTPMFLASTATRSRLLSAPEGVQALKLSMYFRFVDTFTEIPIEVSGAAGGHRSNFSPRDLLRLFLLRVSAIHRWRQGNARR